MSLSASINNVNLILNKDQHPIPICVVINFESLSKKNRLMYALNRSEKLEYQKNYHEQNKDKYLSYQKGYYEKRKDKLLAEKKEKVLCECGSIITAGNLTPHRSTNLHTKRLNMKLCMNEKNSNTNANDKTQ
jgi:hypothetical protein